MNSIPIPKPAGANLSRLTRSLKASQLRFGSDSWPSGHQSEFVAGRNPAKVEEAKKAALGKGVPPEFIESMQGYTGVAAIFETGRPGPVLAIRFGHGLR